jgi:hypothetical protein
VNLEVALDLARRGRLYPSVIVHGGRREDRLAAAAELGRTLLCDAEEARRPCGVCRNCRRIAGAGDGDVFHPDFHLLERDLRTSTSVEATRQLLRALHQAPFEARGQVFVVAEGETLTDEAANALLKALEEPPTRAPRHFLLAAPAQLDLLPTLRSRSWSLYLGSAEPVPETAVEALADTVGELLEGLSGPGKGLALLQLAGALEEAGDFRDLRASRPWLVAATALLRATREQADRELRRRLLALAQAVLEEAPEWRLRAVSAARILEGLVARHLGGRSAPSP